MSLQTNWSALPCLAAVNCTLTLLPSNISDNVGGVPDHDVGQTGGLLSHLDSGQGGHDGGGAEAVCDEREVSEMSLYTGLQQGLGPGVAQR